MGEGINAVLGISSTLSPHQSSDLEKTQVELRQTFTAAEKFRRELEFLQKGGNPLDLTTGSAASARLQSTLPTDQHLEQFVTSEAKGSFVVTASPHGDSVGSSGRLGTSLVCEPNGADTLVLFDGDNKFGEVEKRFVRLPKSNITPLECYTQVDSDHNGRELGDSAALELPKLSYERRSRYRSNRDGAPSSSSDAALPRGGQSFFSFHHTSRVVVASNQELESLEGVEQDNLAGSQHPPCVDTQRSKNLPFTGQINGFVTTGGERKSISHDGNRRAAISSTVLDSESSCTQTCQSLYVNNERELPTNPKNVASNEVPGKEDSNLVEEKEVKILNFAENKFDSRHRSDDDDGSVIKEEKGLKGSESSWKNESMNLVSSEGVKTNGPIASKTDRKPPTDISEQFVSSQNNSNLVTKEREDSILNEAQIIEAKRKRVAELSVCTLPPQKRHNSYWDFVLEEMSWLANDFAQERLWKVTAAAQISRQVAFASHIRYQQQKSSWKQKEVAQTLGRAVMEFWHTIKVKCKESELQCLKMDPKQRLKGYAMRFLEYNNTHAQYNVAHMSLTCDMMSDGGVIDISWEDKLIEENLVYMVQLGATEAYRKSIESHLLQYEITSSSMQVEVDTSGYDAVADIAFEEDDGETRAFYLPGAFVGSKVSKAAKKRRKNFKFYTARLYEKGAVMPFMQSIENNIGSQQSVISRKWHDNSLNVSIPIKHVRTATRQRVVGPFNASSGDTNSFQDEQSSLHGADIPNNMAAESVTDYERQFDSVEVSDGPRKKKKVKHPESSYDHRWQLDSNLQNNQKDRSRRSLDAHQLDSNGSNGLSIQHNLKKLKMRQSSDNSFDNLTPLAQSIPSPVTSEMSNMSNPKKFMELLVCDRGRKSRTHKIPVGQQGSRSPWSLFEDQSLVVLVHDMGPNWELISDAINSSLQFKCIFRSSKECKERYKILMDRNTGDGADNAEDFGSSRPYPSTLPGIPEGSARQLFQRLQGPMEEETLKSHFEKIIVIGQRQYFRTQNDKQDSKQLHQPHSSHALALSQVSLNNINGGPVLTPLELCDAIASSSDVPPVGYKGSHSGGLPILDQANGATMLPGSSSSSSIPGSSTVVLGNDFSSSSFPLNLSVRDVRYGVPKSGSLLKDDQLRMQQYNQMLSARSLQQSNLSPGSYAGTDGSGRMLPTGNGVGVMSGLDRNMTMVRPGFPGVPTPSMPNTGSMLSSGMIIPKPGNMHPRAGPGQGNSMLRPHDAMNLMRPNQNSQIPQVDLQMQQGGSSQGVPQFASGMTSSFSNQATQPSVQSYPHQHADNQNHLQGPLNHATNTSHPDFEMHLMKERQLHQLLLQRQQFATSNAMRPLAQPPNSQHPVSSRQNGTQIQSQSSPPILHSPMGTPLAQNAQKHPLSPHGFVTNPQTGGNQIMQQQHQHLSQQFQTQSLQQAKLTKIGPSNLYSGPSRLNPAVPSASKQLVSHSSLIQPHQQKTYSSQMQTASSKKTQQQKASHSSDNTNNQNHVPSLVASSSTSSFMTNSNHQHPQSQPYHKLPNLSQATTAKRATNNCSVNFSESPISKLQTRGTAQIEQSMAQAPCTNAKPCDTTEFGTKSMQKSPPEMSSPGASSGHSGPIVNRSMVHRKSSPDSMANPVGHDVGVQ